MSNKTLYAILLTVFVAVTVGAQSGGSDTAATFEREGFGVIRSRTQGGLPVYDLATDDGERFSVTMIGPVNDERLAAIHALTDIVYALDGLTVERMRIVFDDDRGTAVVVPERFEINGKRYARYMPSGMQFMYDQAPEFDFRMLVENLAVRINGAFLTEEQFLTRLERAVENPAAYIQSSDPQFLAQQIAELQRIVDTLEVENRELRAADTALATRMAADLDQLRRSGARELREQVSRGEAAMAELQLEVDRVSEETTAALENVVAETLTLADQFAKLRDGAVVMASRNLFGSLKGVPAETIGAVVELRNDDPELTADEARTKVNESLPEGEPQLHGKHVQAIYALFFNDYE
ncbi:MAG: hypothetical protein PF508_01885 [Spirochaeta sp.]|jgi:hypothetical protein|nr:hypothetical protein [Spirochaeta sp.]